jgi:hypothetical protein
VHHDFNCQALIVQSIFFDSPRIAALFVAFLKQLLALGELICSDRFAQAVYLSPSEKSDTSVRI